MTKYIYPQNLKATANLWLWGLHDFAIACVAMLISILALTQLHLILPFALTVAYAFLSIRLERSRCWIMCATQGTSSCSASRNTHGGQRNQQQVCCAPNSRTK